MGNTRVLVAMSGGVDSSVTCYLLQKQGFDVVGVSLQVWDYRLSDCDGDVRCCSPRDFGDARRVSELLQFPYYVMNVEEEFERRVITNFVDEYIRGYTPNPCIHCNYEIKWPLLLARADVLDAEYIATGHYARIVQDEKTGGSLLFRSTDRNRDQTYFLYNLTREYLSRTLFPLGELNKGAVREIADNLKLPVADKRDSQEICFVDRNSHHRFIKSRVPGAQSSGDVLDRDGNVLGKHRGIYGCTIGQRKGFGIAGGKPLYVTSINPITNTVTLGDDEELWDDGLIAVRTTWISGVPPSIPLNVQAKIRYRSPAAEATIMALDENNTVYMKFNEPQRAITPGQAVVFYQEDNVLGGAWIEQSFTWKSGIERNSQFRVRE